MSRCQGSFKNYVILIRGGLGEVTKRLHEITIQKQRIVGLIKKSENQLFIFAVAVGLLLTYYTTTLATAKNKKKSFF